MHVPSSPVPPNASTQLAAVVLAALLPACGQGAQPADAGRDAIALDVVAHDAPSMPDDAPAAIDALPTDAPPSDAIDDAPAADTAPPPPPCTTRITYGNAWLHAVDHPSDFDVAPGVITWDGSCTDDGAGGSYTVLSNGWRPLFHGSSGCVIALDYSASCPSVPTSCSTRVTYGPAWLHADGHPAQYDDVNDVIVWNGACSSSGGQSSTTLSNGWLPLFHGANSCAMSFRYTQCGGLYANPVVDTDCPDPGVARDGSRYVMACTSGNGADAYPMRTSTDLVHWTFAGFVFPSAHRPSWATGDFWAPEIHQVGDHWVAYFSARNAGDGSLALGAASGPGSTGPFTDIGHPLLVDPHPGVIDVSEYEAPDHTRYLIWKTNNGPGTVHTPIHIQPLAPDGLSLTGSATTLITNDLGWEGADVEGPWMIDHDGMYYLFYSANDYASTAYAVGVARASSPTGPFTKHGAPILVSDGAWSGPGHGSVVLAPGGEWVHVHHAWAAGHINTAPGREVLVDRVTWSGGWPQMLGGPSAMSQPPL